MAPLLPTEAPGVVRILQSFDAPYNKTKVHPSEGNDRRLVLGCTGKNTRKDVLQLTGCINRSHSEPFFRTQPQGWQAARYRNDLAYTKKLEHLRKDTISRNPSIHLPDPSRANSLSALSPVRDHVPPENLSPSPYRNEWYSTLTRSHSSPGARNIADGEYWNFRPGAVGPTSVEIMRKSKDHVGYGNGKAAYGKVTKTSVSDTGPSWFSGLRVIPGPYGAPRYSSVEIEDGKMRIDDTRYVRGDNLSIVEAPSPERRDSSRSDTRTPRFDDWREYKRNVDNGFQCVHGLLMCDRSPCENKALVGRSFMIGSGCTVRNQYYPRADMVSLDPPFVNRTPSQLKLKTI